MPFELFSLRLDDDLLVRPVGEIDFSVREDLDALLVQVRAACPERITVDFADLTFMDSTGAAWLAHLQATAAGLGASVELLNLPRAAQRVLRACRLLHLLPASELA